MAASNSFYATDILPHKLFASAERCANTALLEPVTRQAVAAILAEASLSGMALQVFETYRSRERQAMLYREGVTQLSEIGTHHFGLACDVVRIEHGVLSWQGDYQLLGTLARRYGLIWGGDWGHASPAADFVDVYHLQRCAVSDQPKLFAGTWYPASTYHPYTTDGSSRNL